MQQYVVIKRETAYTLLDEVKLYPPGNYTPNAKFLNDAYDDLKTGYENPSKVEGIGGMYEYMSLPDRYKTPVKKTIKAVLKTNTKKMNIYESELGPIYFIKDPRQSDSGTFFYIKDCKLTELIDGEYILRFYNS